MIMGMRKRGMSLRARVNLLTASLAAAAVFVSVVAIYFVTEQSLRAQVNDRLSANVDALAASAASGAPLAFFGLGGSQTLKVALITEAGDVITAGTHDAPFDDRDALRTGPEMAVAQGHGSGTSRELAGYQVLARKLPNGQTLVVAESLQPSKQMLSKLLLALSSLGALIIVLSVFAASAAISTGLRPVRRLVLATERIARTQELQPIPVHGHDELAQFTRSFNLMLEALTHSRDHQRALIVDAGRDLFAPLTALRTNLELLIMASDNAMPTLSDSERQALSSDVIEQIGQLSRIVGELVDRARERDLAPAR
jgi:two-component system sensor histidine kinase MprB